MSRDMNGSHLDPLFSNSAARRDRWRDLNAQAKRWAAQARAGKSQEAAVPVQEALAGLRAMEAYFAYPGVQLLRALDDRLADGDALGTARLRVGRGRRDISGGSRPFAARIGRGHATAVL
ncbi:hypothetical protein G6F31_015390 [Rhizopus arrhizus]|nr:hypothetical protein G6F31_015390 [Rhizopus arrhizus]